MTNFTVKELLLTDSLTWWKQKHENQGKSMDLGSWFVEKEGTEWDLSRLRN